MKSCLFQSLIIGIVVTIIIILYLFYVETKRVFLNNLYDNASLTFEKLYDKEYFNFTNTSVVNGGDEPENYFLSRVDNRKTMIKHSTFVYFCKGKYISTIVPFTRKFLVLQFGHDLSPENRTEVLKPQILPGMHPKLEYYEQFDNPRIYMINHRPNSLFFTADVIMNDNTIQTVIFEYDRFSWDYIRGKILKIPGNCPMFQNHIDGHMYAITSVYPKFECVTICLPEYEDQEGHQTKITKSTAHLLNQKYVYSCAAGPIAFDKNLLIVPISCKSQNNEEFVKTVFMTLDRIDLTPKKITHLYSFTKDESPQELVAGLCWNNNKTKLIVTMGLDDVNNLMVEIDPSSLFNEAYMTSCQPCPRK